MYNSDQDFWRDGTIAESRFDDPDPLCNIKKIDVSDDQGQRVVNSQTLDGGNETESLVMNQSPNRTE
jgi:hypothetical protein